MSLISKIGTRDAVVAVLGIGYVGLPLAVEFAEAGFRVIGVDVNSELVDDVNRGVSRVGDVPSERLSRIVGTSDSPRNVEASVKPGDSHTVAGLSATCDYDALNMADIVIICVPTPLDKAREPDVSRIIEAVDEVSIRICGGMLIILESTTYPGTTEDLVLPRLETGHGVSRKVGEDFHLAFSAERIDPGRTDWTISNTPKVVGGMTTDCTQIATALYASIVSEVVQVSSPKVAETAKLLENTYRSTNIALVNEFAIMCDRLDVDVWEVIQAASTKPFGFMPFYPGPGLGGHCIPIDPQYLAWKLSTLDYDARFIRLAAEINFAMPSYVVNKVTRALNENGKAIKGANILVLGVAYKADIDDVRESPALDIIQLLKESQAQVTYHDPFVPSIVVSGLELESATLDEVILENAECVVIATNHTAYDWAWILSRASLIVDTRNATGSMISKRARVVKL